MAERIKISAGQAEFIRSNNPRLMSYNIEMTEITGGTFWKEYTGEQIAGREAFPPIKGFQELAGLMQWYEPINLSNPRLRKLTAALGKTWIRVSGSWATKTFYDFDGHTGGIVPEGFQSVLTKTQWQGVLDFVKAMDGKLLVSLGNCPGNHPDGSYDLSQAELLFKFSSDYGVPISAVEFMNEPNMLTLSGAPKGYGPADYIRDQDAFASWLRKHYPDCLLVGPCSIDAAVMGGAGAPGCCSTAELMEGAEYPPDIFSYHYYNGVSERLASVMPGAHWPAEAAASENYLSMAGQCAKAFLPYRDKYTKSKEMWVTESGDAGGGGDTWASTYLDVLRTLNELGEFSEISDGVIFHNTLASSDYGFLKHGSFEPRPNYYAVLMWNSLMGNEVYDAKIPRAEGRHVFCHSRKDGKNGLVYLIINNSLTEDTEVEIYSEADRYTLSADNIRGSSLKLNGEEFKADCNGNLPQPEPLREKAGRLSLPGGSCTFLVI